MTIRGGIGDSRWAFPPPAPTIEVRAAAKLTLSLRVTGVRADGYHLLDAEMVAIDLADTLTFEPGFGIAVVDAVVGGLGIGDLGHTRGADGSRPRRPANLVTRALELVGRQAAVRLVKRVPVGAGLGGGSADAAAVLRWAGWPSASLAAPLGADVPFCVTGGRARVTGIGDVLEPLGFEARRYVLLVPPLAMDTGAVYRAYDALAEDGAGHLAADAPDANDLEAAALAAEPKLARWRDSLGDLTGKRPRLAGSGSTWFVEGDPGLLGIDDRPYVVLGHQKAPLVAVRTLPPEEPVEL